MLSHGWVRIFRVRHEIKSLQSKTSNKLDSTQPQLESDNVWRKLYADVVRLPAQYGIENVQGELPPHVYIRSFQSHYLAFLCHWFKLLLMSHHCPTSPAPVNVLVTLSRRSFNNTTKVARVCIFLAVCWWKTTRWYWPVPSHLLEVPL